MEDPDAAGPGGLKKDDVLVAAAPLPDGAAAEALAAGAWAPLAGAPRARAADALAERLAGGAAAAAVLRAVPVACLPGEAPPPHTPPGPGALRVASEALLLPGGTGPGLVGLACLQWGQGRGSSCAIPAQLAWPAQASCRLAWTARHCMPHADWAVGHPVCFQGTRE